MEATMKFQVGDEIVNVTAGGRSFWNWKMPLYTRGIIVRVDETFRQFEILFKFQEYPDQVLTFNHVNQMELHSVFCSPLYEALK